MVLALSAPWLAYGEDRELARLREEAAKLRQALDGLEAKIRVLESRESTTVPTPGTARASDSIDSLVALKRAWSRVTPGIPRDRVQTLLGAPENILHIDGALAWYYVYPGIGRGSVFFKADGTVSSRQPPGPGW